MKKKLAAGMLIALSAMTLTACGGTSGSAVRTESAMSYDAGATINNLAAMPKAADMIDASIAETGSSANQNIQTENQKLIRTVDITLELKDNANMSESVNQVAVLAAKSGGYIESNSSNFGDTYSSANLTIKIPSDKANSVIDELESSYDLVRISDNVEDVTLQYTDVESRLKVKEEMRDKYMSYLEQAKSIEDIMSIESRLSEVIADIESYQSQLNVLNSKIDYTTIYVNINSDVKEIEIPFGEKFADRMKEIGDRAGDMFLSGIDWFVNALIVLLFVLPIIGIFLKFIIFIFKGRKRKKKDEKETQEIKKMQEINPESSMFSYKKTTETKNIEEK